MSEQCLSDVLTKELCDSITVREDGSDLWTISSPLLFDDGDAMPIFVRRGSDGRWSLTDQGMTVSHLFFDEFEFTEAGFGCVARLVAAHSAVLGETHEICMPLSGRPDAFAVGAFMQLLAQVQGVALTLRSDRVQTRYATGVRSSVRGHLATPDYEENWSPPEMKDCTKPDVRRRARTLKRRGFGNKAIARKLGISEAQAQGFTQGMPPGRN